MAKSPSTPDVKTAPSPATQPPAGRWQAFLQDRERRDRWLTTALLAAFALGGFAMWRNTRGFVVEQDAYQVDPQDVEITATPSWIRSDVRDEALRAGGLDKSPSVLDGDLTERVSAAFAAHPWVERVDRVTKLHPARVEVDLVYRRPVCMVELPNGYNGVYPVDAAGVLLPTNDFTPEVAEQYPRLVGALALPAGKVGAAWGDSGVTGGASVAAALAECWLPLKLQRIIAVRDPQAGDRQFHVVAENGAKIIWGHAPISATAGEPTPADKLAALKQALSSAAPGSTIDLRRPLGGKSARTAAVPDAESAKF